MREILFKAKRVDNGEWVEGYLLRDDITGQFFIHASGNSVNESDKVNEEGCLQFLAFEVDESTICQSTGIYDNNRIMIFENDIVCHKYNTYEDDESEDFLTVRKEKKKNYVIKFDSTPSFMGYRYHNGRNIFPFKKGTVWNGNDEVVGNIHDNPELLGGSE